MKVLTLEEVSYPNTVLTLIQVGVDSSNALSRKIRLRNALKSLKMARNRRKTSNLRIGSMMNLNKKLYKVRERKW